MESSALNATIIGPAFLFIIIVFVGVLIIYVLLQFEKGPKVESKSDTTKFCVKCGKTLLPDADYCAECGEKQA